MAYLRLIVSAALLFGLIWLLHQPVPVGGGKNLPPLGKFLNPFSGFWHNAEPVKTVFPASWSEKLPGLNGKVDVLFDDLMVPHIFAQNLEDAVRVQGYLTARDRLWQMDISSRKAAGRLAEVIGENVLRIDRRTRREGLPWAAERDLASWEADPKVKALLDAYTAGVNAWIDHLQPADYPIEFKILNYQPERWTNLKTAHIAESMAETLVRREFDLPSTITRDRIGAEEYASLFPDWFPKQRPIVPDNGQWGALASDKPDAPEGQADSLSLSGSMWDASQPPASHDEYQDGSNNWALSGARTQSGKPLLANDPHLTLTLPSIWYQVQINTPEMNAYGVSLPGIMGIIIGFNEDIAWGITNVSHEVADWYRIRWTDATRSTYWIDSVRHPVSYRVETIGVKGKPDVVDSVTYTQWGPLVHERDSSSLLRDCAFRWLVHDPSEPAFVTVFLNLCKSKNWEDYRAAIEPFDVPAQNFVMATRSGAIGISVQGKFPVRERDQGKFIEDGSRAARAWHGFIPEDRKPRLKDPEWGYVYSANQHSTPPTYPYYYIGDFEDFRGRRIYERLEGMRGATLDSMVSIQLDNFSQRAADALPAMLRLLDETALSEPEKLRVDVLKKWDHYYHAREVAPVFFELWYDYLYEATWDEFITDENAPAMRTPKAWRFIEMLTNDTLSAYFDHPGTPLKETARDVVLEAFRASSEYLRAHPEAVLAGWGNYRPVDIRHLGRIDGFGRKVYSSGHGSAPNAVKGDHGPSWRMLVALEDSVYARGVYPGGQSGNPGSPFYDNMVDTWAAGRYNDLLFLPSVATPNTRIHGRILFEPKSR